MANNAIHIQSPFLPSAFLRQSGSVSVAIHLSPQMALHLAYRNKALVSLQSSWTAARCLLIQHMLAKWPPLAWAARSAIEYMSCEATLYVVGLMFELWVVSFC